MNSTATKNRNLELAYSLITDMNEDNFQYIYRGLIDNETVGNILSIAERSLHKADDTRKTRKRIYFIIVETLQNVIRHQKTGDNGAPGDMGIFILQKVNGRYYITTGNEISQSDIPRICSKIDVINKMSESELKAYYKKMLTTGGLSKSGGAGLGFIAMARRSGEELMYEFGNESNGRTFFYLRTEIQLEGLDMPKIDSKYQWDTAIKLHKMLIRENILLNFNGKFDNNNMVKLLPIIGKQVTNAESMKDRVLKVMLEMLQNIVKYADGSEYLHQPDEIGNPGIFYISNTNEKYYLTAGNYLTNSKVEVLKNKLEFTNALTKHNLIDFYKKLSEFFKNGEINKPDMSILEMKLFSSETLLYSFKPVNDKFSFFTIQVVL